MQKYNPDIIAPPKKIKFESRDGLWQLSPFQNMTKEFRNLQRKMFSQ
jgi:hypothetical protein